jgi:hypothetical protein
MDKNSPPAPMKSALKKSRMFKKITRQRNNLNSERTSAGKSLTLEKSNKDKFRFISQN